jgi:hypothetical protein
MAEAREAWVHDIILSVAATERRLSPDENRDGTDTVAIRGDRTVRIPKRNRVLTLPKLKK